MPDPISGRPTPDISGQAHAAILGLNAINLTVRASAHAVLAAWDDSDGNRPVLPIAMDAFRLTLTRSSATDSRQPRPDTKRSVVLAMLRRPEGVAVA